GQPDRARDRVRLVRRGQVLRAGSVGMSAALQTIDLRKPLNAGVWKRQTEDWYPEPPEATEALLRVERIFGECWDPACGGGNIPATLDRAGIHCSGTDIVARGGHGILMKQEFLSADPASWQRDVIITNP